MIDDLLAELAGRGYSLAYLRQGYATSAFAWEASIVRALSQPRTDGYLYAVGHGSGPSALDALNTALDALEHDATLLEPRTCVNYGQDLPPTPKITLADVLHLHKPAVNPFKPG